LIKENNDNTSVQKVTLSLKNNDSITLNLNTYTPQLKEFLKESYRINTKERRPFSYLDFKNLNKVNFRQIIHKLGNNIERVGASHPRFYKLKGIKLAGDSHKLTLDHMRDSTKFIDILNMLKDQPPKIHAIKIKVLNSDLHRLLLQKGATKNEHNHSIKVNFDSNDNNVSTKILVYPEIIQIDIGCTYKPLVYDPKTIWYLNELLSKTSYYLSLLSGVVLPSVSDWIITHWHFNKDGSTAYNGQSFHFTVEEASTGLLRFYSKNMKDGTTIPRLEQIQTPHNSLEQEMKRAMFS